MGKKGFHSDEDRDRTKEPRFLRPLSMGKATLNHNCQRPPDGGGRCHWCVWPGKGVRLSDPPAPAVGLDSLGACGGGRGLGTPLQAP